MRALTVFAALSLAALLAACGPQPVPAPRPPTSEPSAAPLFASDEEALAAAEEAYAEYLAMSDLITSEGGKNPERIAPYVTPEYLEQAMRGFKSLEEYGRRIAGTSKMEDTRLIFFDEQETQITFCFDVSNSRVLDQTGEDVTPTDRVDRVRLTVLFRIDLENLLVDASEAEPEPC